jgi:hypothetical protein
MIEEQKQEKRKSGRVKKFFKYVGLSILTLLILLALVVEAPKKIVILLVVILAAITILPRPYRKYFWLGATCIVIALTIWIFLPDEVGDWRPYTFDKEIATYEENFIVPDEENAASVYNRLLQDYNPKEWRLSFLPKEEFRMISSKPWLSRDHPELVRWIKRHEETLMALPDVCQMKTCRFPSNFEISSTNKLYENRYFALRSWALILLLSGNNDVAEGRFDEAFAKYIYALRIKEHLYQQKRMNDLLNSFAIEGLVFPCLYRFVVENGLSEGQLRLVPNILNNLENNWDSDFPLCLEYDKLFIKNVFCSLVYQVGSEGVVRFSRDPAAAIWPRWRRIRARTEPFWQKKSMKANTILAWFVLPSTPQKSAEMIDKVFEQYNAMASPDFAWEKEDINIGPTSLGLNWLSLVNYFTNKSIRHYDGFHDVYLKRLTQRRALRTLIAIKQYKLENNKWPDSLEEIKTAAPAEAFIDPVTGDTLQYENHGEHFSLYGEKINIWPE